MCSAAVLSSVEGLFQGCWPGVIFGHCSAERIKCKTCKIRQLVTATIPKDYILGLTAPRQVSL